MKPSQIIQVARDQTDTPLSIVTQDQAYQYLNFVIYDYWKDITDNNTGLGLYTWTYNLTSWTNKYTLPVPSANTTLLTSTFGIYQLTKIGVKLKSTDQFYTPVSLKYIEWYLNLPDYYAQQNLKGNPTAITDGNTITLFPTPTETVTNWLQIIWPQLWFDLSTTTEDVEWCILVPSQWHYVLVEWMKYYLYGKRGSDFVQLALLAKQVYESEKNRTINQMMDRMQESSESFTLDLSYFG